MVNDEMVVIFQSPPIEPNLKIYGASDAHLDKKVKNDGKWTPFLGAPPPPGSNAILGGLGGGLWGVRKKSYGEVC